MIRENEHHAYLDLFIGLEDDGDKDIEYDVDEEGDEEVEEDAAKDVDAEALLRPDNGEGDEHVVSINEREKALQGGDKRAELHVIRANDDPGRKDKGEVEYQCTEAKPHQSGHRPRDRLQQQLITNKQTNKQECQLD